MGASLSQLFTGLANLFRWWVVVAPWEQAVRVRRGKTARTFGAGVHLRIPGLDRWYLESTRLRTISTPIQTVATKDHHTVTVRGQARFRVADYMRVFETLNSPEDTLRDIALSHIAECVRETSRADLSPASIETAVTTRLNGEQYGLADLAVNITDFAFVKAYRLIQADDRWSSNSPVNYREHTEARVP